MKTLEELFARYVPPEPKLERTKEECHALATIQTIVNPALSDQNWTIHNTGGICQIQLNKVPLCEISVRADDKIVLIYGENHETNKQALKYEDGDMNGLEEELYKHKSQFIAAAMKILPPSFS